MARKPYPYAVKATSGSKGPRGPLGIRGSYVSTSSSGITMTTQAPRRTRTNGKSRFGTQPVTGPMMLHDVFGVDFDYVGGYGDEAEVCEDSYEAGSDAMHLEGPRQLEMDFRTNDELEYDLRYMIAKYEYAIQRMGEYAVNWHYLMEDLESNPHLAKMFMDMQVMRKLAGGGVPS